MFIKENKSLQRKSYCDKIKMKGLIKMAQKKKTVSKNSSIKKENATMASSKNYLIAFVILFGSILLALYLFSWYKVKRDEKLMNSYLITTNTIESNIKDLNSLTQVRQEAPNSYFIYFGYTNDEDEYNLEKKLKKVIDKYKLNDIFYYFDVTDLKENNKDYLNKIEKNLNIKDLANVPAIIYVRNNEILEDNIIVGKNNKMLNINDFNKLLDIYDFDVIK